MDHYTQIQNQETIVSVSGRLTFNDHASLRALIRELCDNETKRQIFELSGLEFVDSAGIGMLLIAREELANRSKELVLRGATGQVKRVFTVAQLGKLITIDD